MHRAQIFLLRPTRAQAEYFARAAGVSRLAYNWALTADTAQQLQEANARAANLYRPSIHRKRDGLLLVTCTGRGRFLTRLERLQLWLGLTDADKLERKFCRAVLSAGSQGSGGDD